MRIALLTNGLHPFVMGGMQRHSSMLVQHLPLHGIELTVFHTAHSEASIAAAKVLDGFPEAVRERIQHVFVDYPERGCLPGHYIRDNYRYSECLLEAYHAQGVDFDFIYAKGLTGYAFVEAKKGGSALPPIGMKAHGYEMFQRAANFRVKLEHLILRKAFRMLTQGADYVFSYGGKITTLLTQRLNVPMERIIEIPTGIDPSWIVGSVPSVSTPRRVIFLGRYERRKGIEELHQCIRRWQGPEVKFVFIGPIPENKQLTLPWVEYRGVITDSDELKAALDQGDVLVCPSYSEGMPNVIMEGMARGLAVIATDVGASSEVVSSKNGMLISKLSVQALCKALQEIVALDDETLAHMQESSRQKVATYSWEQVAEMTVQKIKTALQTI